jgi:hypothetical protein
MFRTPDSGIYEAFGMVRSTESNALILNIGDEELKVELHPSEEFQKVKLGEISINSSGNQTIQLSPGGVWKGIELKYIELIKQ